jgi:hypothetical protein
MTQQCPRRGAVASVSAATLATMEGEMAPTRMEWDDAPIDAIDAGWLALTRDLERRECARRSGAKDA